MSTERETPNDERERKLSALTTYICGEVVHDLMFPRDGSQPLTSVTEGFRVDLLIESNVRRWLDSYVESFREPGSTEREMP